MIRNRPDRYGRNERLGVWLMALALVVAAVLGAAAGLIWDYTGASDLFDESEEAQSGNDAAGATDEV